MKQEDEEFEKLLGEIPHATNGSAHGENLVLVSAGPTPAGACTIRVSSMSTGHQNNPSLPGSKVFGQLFPAFQVVDDLQQNEELCHSPSYSGVMPGIIASEDLSNGEDMQRHQPLVDQEEEEPLASLGFAESHSHQLQDASFIAAFSKATLEAEPAPRHRRQSRDKNMNEGMKTSNGFHTHLEFTQGIPVSLDSTMESMASAFSDTAKILPKKLGLPTSCTNNVHSFSGPYRQDVYDNSSCSNGRHPYAANGGMMYAYTAGIGSTPLGSRNDGIDYTRGYTNPSFFDAGTGASHGVVAFPHCNGIHGRVNETTNSSAYYGGSSLDQGFDPQGTLPNAERLDRFQLPRSSFHNIRFLSHQEALTNYVHLEQDVHRDLSISQYCQAQKVSKMQLNWQRKEEEMHRMQRNFDCSRAWGCNQHYRGPPPPLHVHPCTVPSFYTAADQPCRPEPIANMTDWKLQFCPGDLTKFSSQDLVPQAENLCTFSTQGFCNETCPIIHTKCRNTSRSRAFKLGAQSPCGTVTPLVPREKQPICPVKILSRESSRAAPNVVTLSCVDGNKETGSHGHMNGDVFSKDYQSARLLIEEERLRGASIDLLEFDWPKGQVSFQGKYSSLEEVEGHIYSVAKDQHGCRFLQRQFDEGGPAEVEKIFLEIIDHVLELMIDPFGNYLVQKLLEVCNEDQRLKILNTTTVNGELINVSLNMHGTRAVQKLIETLTSSQQVSMVTASLRPGVVTLIKDLNGNHVVQRCLQHLSSDDSQFIFEVVTSHCVEIATHRHGCCVLQRCIDFSVGLPQQLLIAEIAANALLLSQDPFGNYVVQYVLDLGMHWVATKVIEQLAGHFAHLSMQKFSSNVVEKCLKFADEEHKTQVIQELMQDSHLLELLQDPYANYVIQSALMVSKGTLHASLVEAICPHTPFLRSSPYGKRILSRRNLKRC